MIKTSLSLSQSPAYKMKIIVSSDWHTIPGLKPEEKLFDVHIPYLEREMKNGATVILPADILEILRYGLSSVLKDEPTKGLIDRFTEWKEKYDFRILRGNHDLDNPLADSETLIINKTLFAHGHQWDMPNVFWRFLSKVCPPLFRWRTPFQMKREDRWQDYHLSTIAVEAKFKNFLVKNGYSCGVFGHTHMAYTEEREMVNTANCGDWVDSFTWLESEDGKHWEKKQSNDLKGTAL